MTEKNEQDLLSKELDRALEEIEGEPMYPVTREKLQRKAGKILKAIKDFRVKAGALPAPEGARRALQEYEAFCKFGDARSAVDALKPHLQMVTGSPNWKRDSFGSEYMLSMLLAHCGESLADRVKSVQFAKELGLDGASIHEVLAEAALAAGDFVKAREEQAGQLSRLAITKKFGLAPYNRRPYVHSFLLKARIEQAAGGSDAMLKALSEVAKINVFKGKPIVRFEVAVERCPDLDATLLQKAIDGKLKTKESTAKKR